MFGKKKEKSDEQIWKSQQRKLFVKKLIVTILLTFVVMIVLGGSSSVAGLKIPIFIIYAILIIGYQIVGEFRKSTVLVAVVTILLLVCGNIFGKNFEDNKNKEVETSEIAQGIDFYIDAEDANRLHGKTSDGKSDKSYSEAAVKQYEITGNYLIYCTDDSQLMRYDLENQKTTKLADNIQKFSAGSEIVAQNGRQIVSISYDGKNIKSEIKEALLVKQSGESIYYMKLEKDKDIYQVKKEEKGYPVYEYNLESGQDGEMRYVKQVNDVWK